MGLNPDGPVQGTYFDHTQRQNPRWSTQAALGNVASGPNAPVESLGNPFHKTQAMLSFSKTEAIVNQALASAIAGTRLGQAPDTVLFPPRQGFERREPEITDILRKNRFAGRDARFDYSGVTNTYRGTSRPGLGHV